MVDVLFFGKTTTHLKSQHRCRLMKRPVSQECLDQRFKIGSSFAPPRRVFAFPTGKFTSFRAMTVFRVSTAGSGEAAAHCRTTS